jgi:DNA-directed RNA polymerase subunit beta
VVNKHLTDEVVYLSAMEEAKFMIAQANATIDSRKRLTDELVSAARAATS